MKEFKYLKFPNTKQGQENKIKTLEEYSADGWRVVSETITQGKFNGGQACCLFLICAPCAFLAGSSAGEINVTMERELTEERKKQREVKEVKEVARESHMFKNLTDFSYKRDWKEAVGFYLAFLFLLLVIVIGVGGLSGTINGFDQGLKFGNISAVIFCLIISGLLLNKKKLFKNFGYILLFLLSGVLALLGGGLLGLIIPAFITTKDQNS